MTAEFTETLNATARALSGRKDLQLNFGANHPETPLTVTDGVWLQRQADGKLSQEDKAALRGEADRAALVRKHHDVKLHRKLSAGLPDGERFVTATELARIDLLGIHHREGVKHNLERWFAAEPQEHVDPMAMEQVVANLMREVLGGMQVAKEMQLPLTGWRAQIEPLLEQYRGRLLEALPDQQQFHQLLQETLIPELQGEGTPDDQPDADAPDSMESEGGPADQTEEMMEQEQAPDGQQQQAEGEELLQEEASQQAKTEVDEVVQEVAGESERGSNQVAANIWPGYHIYSTEFDEVVSAGQLASQEELARLQQELDDKMPQMQQVTRRLANKLQRLLLARVDRFWQYELEEGLLNNARLPQAIIAPGFPYLYKMEQQSPQRETIVSLLIDNSGSMRGRPITIAALSAELLARTLERCGVKVEILGFTTKEWRGGEARKHWQAHGKPDHPGRLNDLRHIIYKSAEQPLARTRRNLSLMLKEGLLKENIDGEALLWAHGRLLARPEERRILMVISDGAPVDDSTLSLNSGDYLDRHLREVIGQIESKSEVELLAVGIGHDVSRYYRHAIMIDDVDKLGEVMLGEVTKLFEKNKMFS